VFLGGGIEFVIRHLFVMAGVASLAVSAPALADRGHGRGGHGRDAARVDDGGGHGRGARGGARHDLRADRRGGDRRDHRRRLSERQRDVERAIQDERRLVRQVRLERARDDDRRVVREARREDRRSGRDDRLSLREVRREDRRDWRGWATRPVILRDAAFAPVRRSPFRPLVVADRRCPPGLARQNAFCLPPGQVRRAQHIGRRLPMASWDYNVPARYRYRFADDEDSFWRYGNDGAVYRFDRGTGLVSSIVPLTSTGLMLGEPLPLGYDVYNVPLAYRSSYADGAEHLYRYDDNAIFRVDRGSMLVDGIVALLAGGAGGLGGLGIGDLLPSGYDAYNVPLDYRDTYQDTDEAMYRYADGSIYQVDPQTRLIESVISLLA
jgi:hypothetical protein